MSEKFEILSDVEHIRKRPAMYIGSTSLEEVSGVIGGTFKTLKVVPGLLKIISEVIDNSIDEYVRTAGKHANKISIDIVDNGVDIEGSRNYSVTVQDNGRGIPIVKHGKTDETYQPVLAWTKARAGSNFNDDNRITLGANGVGSFCTNVFSSSFTGSTINDGKILTVECNNATIKNIIVTTTSSKNTGTAVTFVPDLSLFNVDEISDDHLLFLKDRAENLAMCYPGIQFTFNGQKIACKSAKDYAARYGEHTIIAQDDNNVLVIAPSGSDEEFRFVSYVNGLWNKNGGSHLDMIMDRIVTPLREYVKKKHKIEVLHNHVRSHLLVAVISRSFPNLKFDSQTKERITNTRGECEAHFDKIDFNKIAKQILNTPELIDPIIQALLFKKEQAERLALARAQKNAKKVRVANHIAAHSSNPLDKTLMITEGLSAIGSLISVRDPKTTGGYPLKGKVMNVRGMKPVDIIKNKEIYELMSILGLKIGEKAENLNYGKIAILTDADTDGSSIACLLVNFFSLWPELFQGMIYRCETPLYICKKGKSIKWFYTKEEFDQFDSKGYEVDYFKGLGSLPKEVYKEVINNPRLVEIKIESQADADVLEMAFGGDSDVRKEWLLQ